MPIYILQKNGRNQKTYYKEVKAAKEAIEKGMAHIVNFTKIIENEAFGALQILSRNLIMKPNWNCFYSAIWQKIIDDTFKGNFIQDLSEVGTVSSSKLGDNS
jgi:hypothetical protein